ncbi:MAG: hypothetical protein HY543_04290 [Deltaproteobacteria bacterium]|nr:hypothetical protein [Deltaproteobacteria bacterium]
MRTTIAVCLLLVVACLGCDSGGGPVVTEIPPPAKDENPEPPKPPEPPSPPPVVDHPPACPPSAKEPDADGDGYSAVCDCAPHDAAIHPAAMDDPDIAETDTNCDGMDGNQYRAIFVATGGNDAQDGRRSAPVATLARAVAVAEAATAGWSRPFDVYLEEGTFDPTDVAWPAAIRLFGGFATADSAQPFGLHRPFEHATILAAAATPLLRIAAPVQTMTIDGITLQSLVTLAAANVLQVDGAALTLRYSRILGSDAAAIGTGIEALNGAEVTVFAATIDPAGLDGTASVIGLWAQGGTVKITNSLILGGAGARTVGIEARDGTALTLVQNTIDGGSRGAAAKTAIAVRLADVNPMLANNLFLTHGAEFDQVVLWCEVGDLAAATIRRNLFAAVPATALHPLVVGCDGTFYFDAGAFGALGANVTENYHVAAEDPMEVVDIAAGYLLTVSAAAYPADDEAAAAHAADTDGVVRDLLGAERTPPYAIGAREEGP